MTNSLLAPLLALAAPLFIWPIELLLPLPFIVEELAKAAIVYLGWPVKPASAKAIMAASVGLLFGFSESVLYLFNFLAWGNTHQFLLRLGLTLPFHALTSLVILLPGLTHRRLIMLGLPPAILIHYLFNSYLSSL